MPFCQNCGRELVQDARFCPNCGSPVALQPVQPQAQYPVQYSPQRLNYSSERNIVIAVVALVVIAVIILAALGGAGSAGQVLISSGTVYPLNARYYQYVQFTLTNAATIYGAFTSTNGIGFFIMTSSEFSSFSSSGSVSSYLYTTGWVSSGSINTNLSPSGSDSYYLVFWNENYYTSSSVTITSPITLK